MIVILSINTNFTQSLSNTTTHPNNSITMNNHNYFHFDEYSSVIDKLYISFPNQVSFDLSNNDVWKYQTFPIQIIPDTQIKSYTFGNDSLSFSYYNVSIFDFNNNKVFSTMFFTEALTLTNMTIPSDMGAGNITFVLSVKLYDVNNQTNIQIISKTIEKQLFWDLSLDKQLILEVDWSYIDYNYWGPNPGWRVIINNNTTKFIYVDDRELRKSYDELSNPIMVIPTNIDLWNEIVKFSFNTSLNKWETMNTRARSGMSDGPGYQFLGIMKFNFSLNRIMEDFDNTDGNSGRTWFSHPIEFQQFKQLMQRVFDNANQTYREIKSTTNNISNNITSVETTEIPLIETTTSELYFSPIFLLIVTLSIISKKKKRE